MALLLWVYLMGSGGSRGGAATGLLPVSAPPATPVETLRVATYNIRYGVGADGTLDLDRIATVLRDFDVDVVVLNEVDRNWPRSGRIDQTAHLSHLAGLPYIYYAPALVTPSLPPIRSMEYGTAILSRIPFSATGHTPLPRIGRREPRNVVAVELRGGPHADLPITVWGAHLSTHRQERALQVDWLAASGVPDLALLMGDFNAHPHQADVQHLLRSGWIDLWDTMGDGPGYTYPSHEPVARIDYILSSPALAAAFRWIRVDTSLGSDHLPVIAEIDLTRIDRSALAQP